MKPKIWLLSILQCCILLVSLTFVSNALATPSLVIDSNGKLTGITGVEVASFPTATLVADVMFMDGTCANLFRGCDSGDDFF